jgi:hypothetical protein
LPAPPEEAKKGRGRRDERLRRIVKLCQILAPRRRFTNAPIIPPPNIFRAIVETLRNSEGKTIWSKAAVPYALVYRASRGRAERAIRCSGLNRRRRHAELQAGPVAYEALNELMVSAVSGQHGAGGAACS